MPTTLTNAELILENETVKGTVVFDETGILAVDSGNTQVAGAIDCQGDYVAPGLIEMHTDNMEKHFMPRPMVFWPNGVAAALAHDAQMAASGITTVYDAICAGTVSEDKGYRRQIFGQIIDAVNEGTEQGLFRIDHKIHIRCELTGHGVADEVAPYRDHPLVQLISLMDHTPGQRQWRELKHLKIYATGTGDKSVTEHDRDVALRMEEGPANVEKNWPLVLEMFRDRGIPIATHDDTTPQHVEMAVASGAAISEFPTTEEAAIAAHASNLKTIMGGPNIVRGGSHSGGVAAASLAEKGLLDGISSDYVPASLLQAVRILRDKHSISLPEAMAKVTWRIADMVGLKDRGRLKSGLRADLIRFRFAGETPVVRELWSNGARAF